MDTTIFTDDIELQRILWACYEQYKSSDDSDKKKRFCYSWVNEKYKNRFGKSFYQQKLIRLANHGILERSDIVRGGGRRYYQILNPEIVSKLIEGWNIG